MRLLKTYFIKQSWHSQNYTPFCCQRQCLQFNLRLVWLKINWFPACSLQFRQLVFSWDIIDWGLLFRASTVFLQFHPCHLRLLALWNSRHHDKCLWHSDISLFKRKIFPARSKHTTEDILVVMVMGFICMIFLVFIGLLPLSNIAEVEFVFFLDRNDIF